MADEPTLPRHPAVSWDVQKQTISRSGKHGRHDDAPPLISTSSDPAVFSSDDDPALDNYAQGRRKKKLYVGAWYAQQPATAGAPSSDLSQHQPGHHSKRTLERQLDSGVWMGSDGTGASLS